MNKRYVLDSIYDALEPIFVNNDFSLDRKECQYYRRISCGSQFVGVPLINYHPAYIFSLNISMSIDRVQDVVHEVLETPIKYRDQSRTMGVRLERFTSMRPAEYRITTDKDLNDALAQLASIVSNKVIPFLDAHMDLDSVDEAMNGPVSVDTSDQPSRGIRALVVAHLAGNPNFDQLVAKYRAEMNGFLPSIQAPYEKMVDYLRQLRASKNWSK